MPTGSQLTSDSQLSMLKCIYHKADETTAQKTFASVQQSLATMNTHPYPSLNTSPDHSDNREGAETCPRPEDVNLEEFSIHFLRRFSIHPNWRQIISSSNDYGQTMAHISVTLGYVRLLRQLLTWEIDLNTVDSTGSTALHYAYLFKQKECAKLLIQSGADQFILDDLGCSPSGLDPSLEVRLYSTVDIDNDSHPKGVSHIKYDTEMPDEARKLYAKPFLVQQRVIQDECERRCQSPHTSSPPESTGTPPAPNSADERDRGVMYHLSSSLGVQNPEGYSTPVVAEEMNSEASIEIAVPPNIALPPSPISEVSAQAQEANRPLYIGQKPSSYLAPLGGEYCIATPRRLLTLSPRLPSSRIHPAELTRFRCPSHQRYLLSISWKMDEPRPCSIKLLGRAAIYRSSHFTHLRSRLWARRRRQLHWRPLCGVA